MTAQNNKAVRGFLINITIAGKTTTKKVEGSSLSVGRLDECDLPLKLETLSRKHATISYENGMFLLLDHGSANGSFINGLKVQAGVQTTFTIDDEIVMGQEAVKFTVAFEGEQPELGLQLESKPPEHTSPMTATHARQTSTSVAQPTAASEPPEPPMNFISTGSVVRPANDPNSPKTADNIILEAQKKAAAIVQKAEIEAAQKTKNIYKLAQEKLDKAEETYQRRLNETYKEVEDIYQKAQTDAQASFEEAKQKADQVRIQNEEYVKDMRQRTEESCEKLLAGAQQSAREMKEKRLQDADEQIAKKHEEMIKAAKADIESRVARLEKDWADELKRRELEFENNHKTLREKHEAEHAAAQKNIEQLNKQIAELALDVTQKQNKIKDASISIEESTKTSKQLSSQIEKSNAEIKDQQKKDADLKSEIQRLTKERASTEAQVKTAQDSLKKIDGEVAAAKKSHADNLKVLETKLASVKEDAIKTDVVVKQNLEQITQLKGSIVKAQDELKTLRHAVQAGKTEINSINTEINSLKAINKRLEDDRTHAETKVRAAQNEFSALKEQTTKINDALQRAKDDFDTQLKRMREKFESDKETFTKQEKEHFEQLKLDTMHNIRKYEIDQMSELAMNRKRITGELTVNVEAHMKENHSVLDPKKIQDVIDRTLRDSLSVTTQNDGIKAEKTTIVQLKKRERIRVATASAAIGALLFYAVQFAYDAVRQDTSPMQRRVAALQDEQREDLEKRKFNPPQTKDYKSTYLDNVVYTENFVTTYSDERFQKPFLKALSAYMFKTWRIDEEKVIALLSTSTTLVKTLADKKEAINPNYIPQGLDKMKAIENEDIKKMSDMLGSNVRYESFKKFEKQFYENFR